MTRRIPSRLIDTGRRDTTRPFFLFWFFFGSTPLPSPTCLPILTTVPSHIVLDVHNTLSYRVKTRRKHEMRYAGRVGKPVDPRMAQASAINHQKLQSLYPVFEWFEINPGYLQKPIGNCFFSAYHGHAAVWPVNHADGLKLICGERVSTCSWICEWELARYDHFHLSYPALCKISMVGVSFNNEQRA